MRKKVVGTLTALALVVGITWCGGSQIASAAGGVVFFQDVYYSGSHTTGMGPGYYTLRDLQEYGFINDWASSVSIPDGWSVTMFSDDDFSGESWRLDQMDFNSENFCNFGGNDVVSSVIIRN